MDETPRAEADCQLTAEQKKSLFDQALQQAEVNVLNARLNYKMAEAALASLREQVKEG